jgi:hypothetical protein
MQDKEVLSKIYSFSTKSKLLQDTLDTWQKERMLSAQTNKALKKALGLN